MMQQRLDFGNFLSYSFDAAAAAAAVWTVEIDFFCLLLVGRENWYEMQNSRWEMEKEEGEGVELS